MERRVWFLPGPSDRPIPRDAPERQTSDSLRARVSSAEPARRPGRGGARVGATHLLWLDTDMRFPGDTLARLLQHEAPVIAANYVKRKPPHTPVTVGLDGKPVYTTKETHGLETVSHTGMGVTLVRAEVFKQIERPWFAFPWLPKASRCAGEDTFFYSQPAGRHQADDRPRPLPGSDPCRRGGDHLRDG